MSKNARIRTVIALLAMVSAACSSTTGTDDAGTGSERITIQTFQFRPDVLEVAVGTEVTWTNQDDIEHTATSGTPGSPDGTFDGELDGPGARFTFTFEDAGVFAYFCDVHQGMRGEIRVT